VRQQRRERRQTSPAALRGQGIAVSGVVNSAFYAFMARDEAFHATEACTACGRCAALCPLGNVTLVDGRPCYFNPGYQG